VNTMGKKDKTTTESKRARHEATVTEHEVTDTETNNYPGNFAELNADFGDDVWDLDKFIDNFRVRIVRDVENELEFDMIGIDPAIANAFRRILISEVPTVAIEKVEIYNNTSLFQDDFLSHRLGLIPIKVDPRRFNLPVSDDQRVARDAEKEDTIAFEMKLKCLKGKGADAEVVNREVLSKHLTFAPLNDAQATRFEHDPPHAVDDDILIAKLSPGQELDLRLVCVKGIGRDHAKFSPVSTASYRLLPKIELLRDVTGPDAELLQESFTKGVIEVVKKGSKKQAKVVDARIDMCSRNIYRHEHLKDAVRMSLVKDHFIFSIESTGALAPNELVMDAIDILIEKCESFISEINEQKMSSS